MKGKIYTLLAIVMIAALTLAFGCAPKAAPEAETGPIVIGYVGQVSSPGCKPCMDVMSVACDEINAAGGVLGRPLKFVVEDSKGETSLAVAAITRMVLGHKALVCYSEGRTEICLAVTPKAVELYQERPHLLFYQGGTGRELTTGMLDEYDKYKFCFRNWNPEDGHYCWMAGSCAVFKEVLGATKIAWLWEDLAWTEYLRNGIPEANLPGWEDYAKQTYGLETVYSAPVKARTGMYLPVLEGIANSGAEVVFYVSSWYTDTEVFAKQWAESSARDIPVYFYGGVAQTYDFWGLTGGKCLGVLTAFWEKEVPSTPNAVAWLQKCDSLGIPVQLNVAYAYTDIYLIKKAIEKVGSTDVEALIKVLEEGLYVEDVGILPVAGICADRIPPHFHSGIVADPKNPLVPNPMLLPDKVFFPMGQFQGKDNVVLLSSGYVSADGTWFKGEFAEPEKYKTPAELRKEAGWPGY